MSWPVRAIAALGLALLLAGPAAGQGSLSVLFARAETLARGGNYEAALPVLDRVIERLDAIGQAPTEEMGLLLRRSLIYRSIARWELQQRDGLNADLDRLIDIDPRMTLLQRGSPEGLAQRFRDRRERKVGYLQIAVNPPDAQVRIDGEGLDPVPDILPVLAGDHVLTASKPGYAVARAEVGVRADRTEGVGLVLERVGATIRLATSPAGAKLMVDGDLIGTTVAASAGSAQSETIVVEGLLPGVHEIEVTLANHRSFRQRIEVPDLVDYDLGVLRMDLAEGIVVLRALRGDAAVLLDGEPVALEWQSGGPPIGSLTAPGRFTAQVGERLVVVTHQAAGVFETRVAIVDGEITTLDVTLRPGIAFLGVVGADDLERQSVRATIQGQLAAVQDWFLLDRETALAGLLRSAGLPERSQWSDGAELAQQADWGSIQRWAAELAPAALYVLAVVSSDGVGEFDLLVWSGSPMPARPWQGRAATDDPGDLAHLVAALRQPLPEASAWLGASLIDTALSGRATVLSVYPEGPAAEAGLLPGDELLSIDGVEVSRVAELTSAVSASRPFSGLTLQYGRGAVIGTARVMLGASPVVRVGSEGHGIDAVTYAATTAFLSQPHTTIPAWTLQLHQALILLQAGHFEPAARLLNAIQAPAGTPFGVAAVSYWYGVALSSGPSPDLVAAREALLAATDEPGARLYHDDGPLVAPRARARLARIRAHEARQD